MKFEVLLIIMCSNFLILESVPWQCKMLIRKTFQFFCKIIRYEKRYLKKKSVSYQTVENSGQKYPLTFK